jgi:hypothetical protein
MGTGLCPDYPANNPPEASKEVECFLEAEELRETLQCQVGSHMDSFKDTNCDSLHIKSVLKTLSHDCKLVVVPINKTNSFLTMKLQDYITDVHSHLVVQAKAMSVEQLQPRLPSHPGITPVQEGTCLPARVCRIPSCPHPPPPYQRPQTGLDHRLVPRPTYYPSQQLCHGLPKTRIPCHQRCL